MERCGYGLRRRLDATRLIGLAGWGGTCLIGCRVRGASKTLFFVFLPLWVWGTDLRWETRTELCLAWDWIGVWVCVYRVQETEDQVRSRAAVRTVFPPGRAEQVPLARRRACVRHFYIYSLSVCIGAPLADFTLLLLIRILLRYRYRL